MAQYDQDKKDQVTRGGSISDNNDHIARHTGESIGDKSDGGLDENRLPTDEERATLRLVSAPIPWPAYAIALAEFAERASYYGCTGGFFNFIQRPLPIGGIGTGATPTGTQLTPGALGLGIPVATALTTSFSFVSYVFPIFGGILADTKWGRYKTICVGTAIAAVAHIILLVAGTPKVIQGGHALAPFAVSIFVLSVGTGMIKANVAPLMADQTPIHVQRVTTLKSGERVILDPGVTTQNTMLVFYWSINLGAFLRLGTSYAEKRIGYWLAFLVPLIVFLAMPIVLLVTYKPLVKLPPQGSVVMDTLNVGKTVLSRGGLWGALKGGDKFWNSAKPSQIAAERGANDTKYGWIKWNDGFVDEIRRTFGACKLFAFLPVFFIADGGPGGIQYNQAGSMTTNGAPNDLLANFNPITILVMAPILNYGVYPYLRKLGINASPIRRIVAGFMFGAATMVVGAILQWRVYKTSPCGYYASLCTVGTGVSPLTIWAQMPLYVLPAIAELLVILPSYEIAYSHAPQQMKGLVFSLVLFMGAFSSALTLIVSPSFVDPYLIWPFVGVAVGCVISAFLIWFFFHKMDEEVVPVVTDGADSPIEYDRKGDTEK